MKRLLLSALTLCLLLAGCDVFGSDEDDCGGREGLFIQTDRDSYQVGSEATLTVKNCTGGVIRIDRPYTSAPDYVLEKKSNESWVQADISIVLEAQLRKIEVAESYEFMLPVRPSSELVDSLLGRYRYVLMLYDSEQGFLPKEERVSNTFDVTE